MQISKLQINKMHIKKRVLITIALLGGTLISILSSNIAYASSSSLSSVGFAVSNSQTGATAQYSVTGTTDSGGANTIGGATVTLPVGTPMTPVSNSTTWSSPTVLGSTSDEWESVSCPSTSECVAVGQTGYTAYSTSPTSNTWTVSGSAILGSNSWISISCPSTGECIAIGQTGYTAYSTSPTSNTWTVSGSAVLGGNVWHSISCPSTSECVAVGYTGYASYSTSPTSNAWTVSGSAILGNNFWMSISCPSTSECVAVSSSGYTVYSTSPTSNTWTLSGSAILGNNGWDSVSCPSTSECVAVSGTTGYVAYSTSPTSNTWTVSGSAILGSNSWLSISCPSISECITDAYSGYVASTQPSSTVTNYGLGAGVAYGPGPSLWNDNALLDITCASTSDCFAVGRGDAILQTTNGGVSWTQDSVSTLPSGIGGIINSISCPPNNVLATTTCYAVGGSGQQGNWVSTNSFIIETTNGGVTWTLVLSTSTSPALTNEPLKIACPAVNECWAVGNATPASPDEYCSTNCLTASNWTVGTLTTSYDYQGVNCPTTSQCYAVGYDVGTGSSIYSWTGSGAPSSIGTIASDYLYSVSCSASSSCIAVGTTGSASFIEGCTTTCTTIGNWASETVPANVGGLLLGVSCVAGGCIATGTQGTNYDSIYTSSVGGSWSASNTQETLDLSMVFCFTATTDCWMIDGIGEIYYSTNLGASLTWSIPNANTSIYVMSYSITSPVSVSASTPFYLSFSNITNTPNPGTYFSAVDIYNDASSCASTSSACLEQDYGLSNSVVFGSSSTALTIAVPESLTFTNSSPSLSLTPQPNGSTATGAITLTIGENANGGYSLAAYASSIIGTNHPTNSITEMPVNPASCTSLATDQLGVSATLTVGGSSGATLQNTANGKWLTCDSNTGFIGYSTSVSPATIISATGPSGAGGDTLVLNNEIKVDDAIPADQYVGTITFVITPSY